MTESESGDAVYSLADRAPRPGGLGESAARPFFARGVTPSPQAEPPRAIGDRDDRADGRVLAGVYPVKGRTAEMNNRIAAHEAGGHAFLARALGSSVISVTIIPSNGFEGRCIRSGASLNLLDDSPAPTTDEIVDICARLEKLTPEIGSARIADAEYLVRAQVAAIELVGGRVAEQILFPDLPPLNAAHDHIEAAAFARVAVAAQAATGDLIRYAEAEAAALIRENLDIAQALIDAIMVRGFMTGHEVDAVIAQAISTRAAEAERKRRADWRARTESARAFLTDV